MTEPRNRSRKVTRKAGPPEATETPVFQAPMHPRKHQLKLKQRRKLQRKALLTRMLLLKVIVDAPTLDDPATGRAMVAHAVAAILRTIKATGVGATWSNPCKAPI